MGQPLGFFLLGWKMSWYSRLFRSFTLSSKVRTTSCGAREAVRLPGAESVTLLMVVVV